MIDAPAPVIEVIDGDTFRFNGERARMEGIDAPEINGACLAERLLGARASDFLRLQLDRDEVSFSFGARDYYGRRLVRVSVGGADLGDAMIEAGLAVAWAGRKADWCGPLGD